MAKLTGQFTTPSLDSNNNKTHKPFQHGVVFVFTGAIKVTRETDAKGKYSFDLANGEYEVSVYLKGNTEKDRFDMRAGEKFVATATTQTDALEKWLQVIGDNGKDELATYYENLLAQMQRVSDDFKDSAQSVGSGKFMKESAYGLGSVSNAPPLTFDYDASQRLPNGFYRVAGGSKGFPEWKESGDALIAVGWAESYWSSLHLSTNNRLAMISCKNGSLTKWDEFYSTLNTTVDSNGNIKAASPIIKLFSDHIESNDSFKEKPIFEKLGTGVYKITNTLGLSQNGWTHNIPLNSNGRGYFRVRVEPLEDGCIVRVFKIKNVLNPDTFEIDVVDGDPVDIGKDQRWIDLRFHEELQKAEEQAEREAQEAWEAGMAKQEAEMSVEV